MNITSRKLKCAIFGTAAGAVVAATVFQADIPVLSESQTMHRIFKTVPARVKRAFGSETAKYCASLDGDGQDEVIIRRTIRLRDSLIKSKTGAALIETARHYKNGIGWVCFIPRNTEGFYEKGGGYMTSSGTIALAADGDDLEDIAAGSHEFRHLEKDEAGLGVERPRTSVGEMKALILYSEADANVISNLVLWELDQQDKEYRLQSHLSQLLNDEARDPRRLKYSDITNTFILNTMKADQLPVEALRSTFRAWFHDDGRIATYSDNAYDSCMNLFMRCSVGDLADTDLNYLPIYETYIPIAQEKLRRKFEKLGMLPAYKINYLTAERGFDDLLTRKNPSDAPAP